MAHKYRRKNRARQRKRMGWSVKEQQRARISKSVSLTWWAKNPEARWKFNHMQVPSADASIDIGASGQRWVSDVSLYDRALSIKERAAIYDAADEIGNMDKSVPEVATSMGYHHFRDNIDAAGTAYVDVVRELGATAQHAMDRTDVLLHGEYREVRTP